MKDLSELGRSFFVWFSGYLEGINTGQDCGGTQKLLLTVAAFQPWRGSKSPAAPVLTGMARIPDMPVSVNRNQEHISCSE